MGACQECVMTEEAGGRVLKEGYSSSSESILLHTFFRFIVNNVVGKKLGQDLAVKVMDEGWTGVRLHVSLADKS